jgi:hypothetical protein
MHGSCVWVRCACCARLVSSSFVARRRQELDDSIHHRHRCWRVLTSPHPFSPLLLTPCPRSPWRILDDCGGAFAMGAIGEHHSSMRRCVSEQRMHVSMTRTSRRSVVHSKRCCLSVLTLVSTPPPPPPLLPPHLLYPSHSPHSTLPSPPLNNSLRTSVITITASTNSTNTDSQCSQRATTRIFHRHQAEE